jgi:hypothetical protein
MKSLRQPTPNLLLKIHNLASDHLPRSSNANAANGSILADCIVPSATALAASELATLLKVSDSDMMSIVASSCPRSPEAVRDDGRQRAFGLFCISFG